MPPAKPFVLLQPGLLQTLYANLERAGSVKARTAAGELRWSLASLVAANAHIEAGDAAAFCGMPKAAALLRWLRNQPAPAKTDARLNNAVRFSALAGIAAAMQLRGSGVVFAFCGTEAATRHKVSADAMHFSAAKRLPILWITQTPLENASPIAIEGSRPRLPRIAVDAEDTVAIYRVMQETIRQARTGGGPTWLDLRTEVPGNAPEPVRQARHSSGKDSSLEKMRRYLEQRKLFDPRAIRSTASIVHGGSVVLEL